MRGAFEDEDEKAERQRPLRDTELTLGTGTLLLLFLGLALVCGACFGLGYEVGRGVGQPASSTVAGAGGQAGPQTNGSKAKPSATAPAGMPAPAPMAAAPVNASQPAASNPAAATQAGTTTSQPQVRPALPGLNTPLPSSDSGMHAVLPPPVQLMVQIAAVSHQEDADVLAAALRKRGYAVAEKREPADGLIHVRMGPFNSRDDAERWRRKLLDDGYNAMIQ